MRLKMARRTEDGLAAKSEWETVTSPVYTVDHTILCHANGTIRKTFNPILSISPTHQSSTRQLKALVGSQNSNGRDGLYQFQEIRRSGATKDPCTSIPGTGFRGLGRIYQDLRHGICI